jgi:hypothetical protein
MPLAQLIANFVQQRMNLNNPNEIYEWRPINENFLPPDIFIEGNNDLERNISLKYALHEAWLQSENNLQRRGDLIQYYITYWGGIWGNGPERMNLYRNSNPENLIMLGLQGIASWSKALVIHDPNQYAIYDVRVVAILNYLQMLDQDLVQKIRFRITNGGRNATINQANYIMDINNMYNGWIAIPQNQVYSGHYLPLLRQSAEMIGTNISTVEMILFNYAPILAEQIIENYG